MDRRQFQETRSPYRKPVTWVQDQVRKETIKFQQLHEIIEQDQLGRKKTKRATRLISDDEYERLKLKPPKNLRQVLNYESEIERWPEVLKLDQALSPWERQRPLRVLETGYNVATKDIVTVAPRWPESERHIPGGSPWKPTNVDNRKEYSETTPRNELEVKRWPENKNIPGAIPWDRPTTPTRLARWSRYNNCYYRKYPDESFQQDQYDNGYRYDQDSSFYSTQYMHDFLQYPNFAIGDDRPSWESDFPLSNEEFYAVQEIRRKLIEALANAPVQEDETEDENEKKDEKEERYAEDVIQDVEESYDQLAINDPSKSANKIYPIIDEPIEGSPKRKKSGPSNTYIQAKSVMTVYGDDSFLPKLLVKEDGSSNPISPNRSAKKVKQVSPPGNVSNSENTVIMNKKPQLFSPDRLDPSPPNTAPFQNGRPSSGHSIKRPLSAYSSGSGGQQQRKPAKYDETVFQSPQGKPQPRPPVQANPRSSIGTERPKSAHGLVHPNSKRNEDEIRKVPETRMNPRELKQFKEQQQQKNPHPLASPLLKGAEVLEEDVTNKRRFFLRDDSIVQNLFAEVNTNAMQQGRNSAPATRAVTPNTLKNGSTPSRPKTAGGRVSTASKQVGKSGNSKQGAVISSMVNNVNQLMHNFSGGDQVTAANKAMIIEMATFSAAVERQKENAAPNKPKPTTTLIATVAASLASSSAASSSTGFSYPSSKTGPQMSNVTTASSLMTRRETIFSSFANHWYEENVRREINAIIKKMAATAAKSKLGSTAVSPRGNSKSAVLSEIENKQKNYMSPIPSFLSELKNNQGLKFQLKKAQNDKNDGNKGKALNLGAPIRNINQDERNEEDEEEKKRRKQREKENEESYQSFLGLMKQLHIPHFELNHSSIAKEIPTLSPFQSKSNLFDEGPLSTPRGGKINSPTAISSSSATLHYDSVTLLGRGKFASVYCVQNKETVSLESILTPVKLAHQNQSQSFQLRSSAHFTPSTSTAATILLTPPPNKQSFEISSSNKNGARSIDYSSNPLYTPTNHHNLKTQINYNELIALKVAQFKDNDLISSAQTPTKEKKKKIQTVPSKAIIEEFQREILSLYHLQKHDNIINLIGYSLHPFGIVMDYIAGQNLYVLLHNEHWQKSITHFDRLKLLVDLSAGLAHIHSRKYIHRDLKPHNIIIEQSESGKARTAKIVDFGTAYPLLCSPQDWKEFYSSNVKSSDIPSQYQGCHDAIGTSGYTAPELFSDDSENLIINYAYSADIFSMSIILWEMMIEDCSRIINPLQGLNPLVAYEEMKRGKRPPLYQEYHSSPRQYARLIEESWCFQPQKRLSADGLFFELNSFLRHHDQ